MACDESMLIIGGQSVFGPLDTIYMWTPSGWCQEIKFPQLPRPAINPVVRFQNNRYLLVCGFVSEPSCMWTDAGSTMWHNLSPRHEEEDYRSSKTFKMGTLGPYEPTSIVTNSLDNYHGHTYTWDNIPYDLELAEGQLATFSLPYGNYMKNVTGSCFEKLGNEMMLIGGRTSEIREMMSSSIYGESDPSVGRMSLDGCVRCGTGEPMWESYVLPSLIQGREDHSCMATRHLGVDVVMVGGGTKYYHTLGKSGMQEFIERERYETLNSVELFDGEQWSTAEHFNLARMGFAFIEWCGAPMAMGGRQYDGEYYWSAHCNGHLDGNGFGDCWDETVTDSLKESFLDTTEQLLHNGWSLHQMQLPQPMANFAVTKVPESICKR